MAKQNHKEKIPVEIEFTEGYEERFTLAILKIYEKRRRQSESENREKEAV